MRQVMDIKNENSRFNFVISDLKLADLVIQTSLIILREIFHKKRILVLSNGFCYFYSPKCDEKNETLIEAGMYAEKILFGKVLSAKALAIDLESAKKLLNIENWKDVPTLHKIADEVKEIDSSLHCTSLFDNSLGCYSPGKFDSLYWHRYDPISQSGK
jgi:hypothetical protein